MIHECVVYHPRGTPNLSRLANDRQWLQLIMQCSGWPGPLHVQRHDLGEQVVDGKKVHVTRFVIGDAAVEA